MQLRAPVALAPLKAPVTPIQYNAGSIPEPV
jgi:hypothetical protein